MEARKLKFILKKAGLRYHEFANEIGKSTVTVQRWISENQNIGEKYVIDLEKMLTSKIYGKLELEWEEYKKERRWR